MKWKSDGFEGSSITKTYNTPIIVRCNHVKRVQHHCWPPWAGSTVCLENPSGANRKMWDLCPTEQHQPHGTEQDPACEGSISQLHPLMGFNLVDEGTALGAPHSPSLMYSSWIRIQPWTMCQIPTVSINEQLTVEPGQRIGCSHGPSPLPAPELNQPQIKTQRSVSITSLIQSRQVLPGSFEDAKSWKKGTMLL